MALRISVPSWSSMPPSCLASSTIIRSSSSVMPPSSENLKMADRSFFHWANRKLAGLKITSSTRRMGAENMAKVSGTSLEILLGETSPNTSTTIVMTSVERLDPRSSPRNRTKITVAREVLVIFTILLPIRMVDSRLS